MYCPECGNVISETEKYCSKCGNKTDNIKLEPINEDKPINPEPKLSGFEIFGLICLTIFVIPIGIIAWIVVLASLQKKKEAWRQEQSIQQIHDELNS